MSAPELAAGARYRDDEGNTWTVNADGHLEHSVNGAVRGYGYVSLHWGPLRRIVGDGHELHEDGSIVPCGDDPVSPGHYKFPGGHEVINITEHLTSNAGQAVQYLARACRIDGRVKGNPVEDLRKAVWFAQRELARIEAQHE